MHHRRRTAYDTCMSFFPTAVRLMESPAMAFRSYPIYDCRFVTVEGYWMTRFISSNQSFLQPAARTD